MGLLKEFKEFAMRGNVIDMAVGIVIGAAFGKIVSSLVANVVMPPIGMLLGGVDFADLKLVLKEGVGEVLDPATGDVVTAAVPEVAIGYGLFINTVIDFVIIAFAIFMVIKVMNSATARFKKKEEAKPAEPPKPSDEVVLLTEIRDALRAR
ncbi:MAG: large-conductance mechanosensitive channel protein MscL [Phycisphaerales bacterium]